LICFVPSLSTDLFDYALPSHLIAQEPAARRDQSRLLVVDRADRSVRHHLFSDLPQFLRSTDLLIRNNAAVLPARLRATRPTGGAVECLLLRPAVATADVPGERWWCLVRPGRKLDVGATFADAGCFSASVEARRDDGTVQVRFETIDGSSIVDVANRVGEVPLPPYIERMTGDARQRQSDLRRYQTVYADPRRQVAVAAPTAGLHFTPELLDALHQQGLRFADVTLHVGLGTFRPIAVDEIDAHEMHREVYEVPPETQVLLFNPGGRRVAVGTTSVRTIEDFLRRETSRRPESYCSETDLFIRPPATFGGVDALITNFHQPRSTLLCLVSAFLTPGSIEGIDWLKQIYAEAIAREYRFFSYGDAMLIL
jgi:S-adenosylmethionine:tRNA ribosyltransferase-isomerase